MLLYEKTYGIKKRWLLLVLAMIPVVFIILSHMTYYVSSLNENIKVPTSINYHLGKILYGIRVSNGYVRQRNRQIPIQWLIIQFSYLLIINGFIHEEIKIRNCNIVRYGTYTTWWKRKIIWFYIISACYYMILGACIFIEQRIELIINIPEHVTFATSNYGEYSQRVYIYTSIYFIMHSLLLGMLQLCLELKIQSTVALIINFGLLILGVFSIKIITPCHLAMIIRNGLIIENSILANSLIVIGIICLIVESNIGRIICKNGL